MKHYAPPTIGILERIVKLQKQNRYIRCRKKVVCFTKCRCGKYYWNESWKPENEANQYLYGILKNYSLAGRPYCDLLPGETARKKMVCTPDEAIKCCGKRLL
jgi:hypothetical protein